MILIFIAQIFSVPHFLKIANSDNYIQNKNNAPYLGPQNLGAKFRFINISGGSALKKIRIDKLNLIMGTEKGTNIVKFYPDADGPDFKYELRVLDYDRELYMLAQGKRCVEWCTDCDFFKMTVCDDSNSLMQFQIEGIDDFLKNILKSSSLADKLGKTLMDEDFC